jgi:hypothetical protein
MWCYQLARDQCIFLGVLYKLEKNALCGNHVCQFVCNLISALDRFFLTQWRLSLKHRQFLVSAMLNHNRTYFTQSHTWTFINRPQGSEANCIPHRCWQEYFKSSMTVTLKEWVNVSKKERNRNKAPVNVSTINWVLNTLEWNTSNMQIPLILCDVLKQSIMINIFSNNLSISWLGPTLPRGHFVHCRLWRRQDIRFLPVGLVLFHRIRLTSLTRTMLCPQWRATLKGAIVLLLRHAMYTRTCAFFVFIFNLRVNSLTSTRRMQTVVHGLLTVHNHTADDLEYHAESAWMFWPGFGNVRCHHSSFSADLKSSSFS